MVVGDEGRVLSHGQLPVGSSDHDLIYLVLSLFPPKPTPKLITCRNFKNFEANLFLDDARSADWNLVYSAPDIDSKVLTFNNIVTSLFDKHAPFRTFIAKHQPVPWMTPELKHLINRRDEASRKFAQSKSPKLRKECLGLKLRSIYSYGPLTSKEARLHCMTVLDIKDVFCDLLICERMRAKLTKIIRTYYKSKVEQGSEDLTKGSEY
ncbi:hypothetical protein M8J76_011579 [Diaphorina citri]|nr:hypothetical protein M8J76_011579 [Diaphorina citri]